MFEAVYPVQESTTSSTKHSVFMIDDCEDMLTLGRLVLEKEGFEVSTATGAQEAFSHLSHAGTPDLILLDCQMSEMDGPELMKCLKERFPVLRESTAFVFYSGLDEEPDHDADGFIRKNGDISSFVRSLQSYIT